MTSDNIYSLETVIHCPIRDTEVVRYFMRGFLRYHDLYDFEYYGSSYALHMHKLSVYAKYSWTELHDIFGNGVIGP